MKILVIKTGALGDVVRTSFIAQALKEKYNKYNPEIYWLTQKKAKNFFLNNPYISRIGDLESKYKLKKVNFDLIINLEESEELCKFASSLTTRKIIGFVWKNNKILSTPEIKEWFDMSALGKKPQNDILKKQNKKTHRQLMAEIINVDYKKYEPFIRLTKKQRELADNFKRRHNISKSDLIIGINTGCADRWPKQLSIKKTSQLIDNLHKKFNAKILIFGGPNEIERNREILKLTKTPVITTGCGNDLVEFPALISVCNLFITSDSLGLHIALALKRKTICLVGPTSSSELDMYNLGEKVIAKSKCLCCYKSNCKSMEKINVKEILEKSKKILSQKITLLITAFKEPNIDKAIKAAINQKTRHNYNVLISAPDKETISIVNKYSKKHKNIKIFKDPGKGKSYAINLALNKIKTDILILTDGDVVVSDNTIEEISNMFLDPEIGCITGKPVPQESRNSKYGYWANFLFDAAHKIRKKAFDNNSFIECSGYLFAFRKSKIKSFPIDVAEDSIIPYYFWQTGYKIGYADKAEVYVKNPDNLKDWIKQKIRTNKSHKNLGKYADIKTTPRVKTFGTEAKGIFWLIRYPTNLNEFIWTIELPIARLYVWAKYFLDTRFFSKNYRDGWERIESTK